MHCNVISSTRRRMVVRYRLPTTKKQKNSPTIKQKKTTFDFEEKYVFLPLGKSDRGAKIKELI